MAWGIEFDGTSTSSVVLDSTIAADGVDGNAQDWEFEFRWTVTSGDEANSQRVIGQSNGTQDRIILRPNTKEFRLYYNGLYVYWVLGTFPSDAIYKVVKPALSDDVELLVDSVSQGTKTPVNLGMPRFDAFNQQDTSYGKGTLHYFTYTDNNNSANSVNFAIEEGSGSTVTDSLNGVVGTLGANVSWVSEGGGGVTLSVADTSHGHLADGVTLTIEGVLSVAGSTHAHTTDNIGLTQANVITIAEATHAHSADNVVLSAVGVITLPAMKNNTGTVNASDTGITVDVYSIATGALVERFTSETTDASGICSVSSSNLTPGTSYVVVVRRSTDAIGLAEVAAS